jgi:hypothetical protein
MFRFPAHQPADTVGFGAVVLGVGQANCVSAAS